MWTRLLVMLLALAAITALAPSAASAAFTLETTRCGANAPVVTNFCWNTSNVLASSEPLELKGEEEGEFFGNGLKFFTPTLSLEIECKKSSSGPGAVWLQSEVLGPLAKDAQKTHFLWLLLECGLVGTGAVATKCVIPSTLESKLLTVTLVSETEALAKPEEGTTFIEISFTSKTGQTCPATVIGLRKVTGAQLFTTSTEAEEAGKTFTTVVKSELLFAEKAAELETKGFDLFVNIGADWDRQAES